MPDGWVHSDWLPKVILWLTVPMTVKWNPSRHFWACSILLMHLYWIHVMLVSNQKTMLHLGSFANWRQVGRFVTDNFTTVYCCLILCCEDNNTVSQLPNLFTPRICNVILLLIVWVHFLARCYLPWNSQKIRCSFLPRYVECRRGLVMRKLSVCLSIRLSNAWIVTKWKKDLSRYLYHTKDRLA